MTGSKAVLHRPARMLPPPVPDLEVRVVAPPGEHASMGMSWWPQLLFPLVSVLGSAYFIVYNPQPTYIAISLTMVLASVSLSVAMVLQQFSAGRRRAKLERERYLGYLRSLGREARETARRQEDAARFTHPDAHELWGVACGQSRLWERRPEHPDFATVRIGLGPVPLATPLQVDSGGDPMGQRHGGLQAALDELIAKHSVVPGQPVLVDLRGNPVVSLVGPPALTRALARTLVTQLATFCAPDDLVLAVCHPPEGAMAWECIRWLPHAIEDDGSLRSGDGRLVLAGLAEEVARRRERLRRRAGSMTQRRPDDDAGQPLLLVVVDGFSASSPLARADVLVELADRAGDLGASLLFLVEAQPDEPPRVDVRVRVGPSRAFVAEDAQGDARTGHADGWSPIVCEAIARRLAPLRLSEREAATALSDTCRLVELLGVGPPGALDVRVTWAVRPVPDLLRVPIGVGSDGGPQSLDLKEAALGGMGPHGLVIGATGSGKSELLRTLVTALALTHPPETLGFVLVDFKGGAAFAGLAGLPHVAGMITNLADDLTMVDRMHSALFGELQRRQALLRRAGDLDSVREYQRRREAGRMPGAEPLPYLLIIVDEFSELLANRPEFIELFVAIGRVGRSIGMHLLLASQRLEEGRLRGLDSHLSYRICLRTFSAGESHAVIGTPDAYHLPAIPGSAYLKVHTDVFDRFKAALVSGPDRSDEEPVAEVALAALPARGLAPVPTEQSLAIVPVADAAERPSEMAVAVQRIAAAGADRVHQVWLPPLEAEIPLARLLHTFDVDLERGLQAHSWQGLGSMRVPVGIVDLPEEQSQRPFVLDFAGGAGHLALVGAPQSGKSTLLRTMVLSLLLTHTPDEVRVYAIDYGGGSLLSLPRAPHAGDVAGRLEQEKVRRMIGQVWSLVDERDERLRELGIDSVEELRRRRAGGAVPAEVASDVFLVIDGWGAVREDVEDLEPELRDIAARGLRVGCHLVLTANRWFEVRPNLRDLIGGRLELHLNDPSESEIDRRASMGIPAGVPGRGLAPGKLQFQACAPVLERGLEALVAASQEGWKREGAPAVRLLPERVTLAELGAATGSGEGVPIGVDEFELAPVRIDLGGADAHFVLFGDSESGKTTFLRSWMAGLQARQGPEAAMFVVVDYRRTLVGAVTAEQLWAYCGAAPQTAAAVKELAAGIVERQPPPTVTPEAMADRSWWTGPDFYVVVDDYDLVASPSANPLAPLAELLAQGRDLGLHVVVARRAGGMSRAGLEPVLSRLRDLHTPGLLLSGDPSEGPILGGQRARPQPPGRGLLVRRKQRPLLVQVVDG